VRRLGVEDAVDACTGTGAPLESLGLRMGLGVTGPVDFLERAFAS